MRKLLSVVVGAGLLVSLAACSSAPAGFASCTEGGNAALVTAAGGFGSDPKAEFPTPLISSSSDVHVVKAGDGSRVTSDEAFAGEWSVYDGETGDALSTQDGQQVVAIPLLTFVEGSTNYPFTSALACATVGSRVSITGTGSSLLNITDGTLADATLVIIVDVDSTVLGRANGADQVPQSGFPAVVLAPNGRPGITFPAGDVPTDLKIAALKQGNGATVADGDSVIVNQALFDWDSKTALLDPSASTWEAGSPRVIVASDSSIPKGLAQALIGQKVGSQVIVIAPPDFGYPDGSAPTGVTAGATLVFVVDILGIQP